MIYNLRYKQVLVIKCMLRYKNMKSLKRRINGGIKDMNNKDIDNMKVKDTKQEQEKHDQREYGNKVHVTRTYSEKWKPNLFY